MPARLQFTAEMSIMDCLRFHFNQSAANGNPLLKALLH
jgi:hypothetical protein